MIRVIDSPSIVSIPSQAFGSSICIIGYSTKGPILEPIFTRSISDASSKFGEGKLIQAFEEATRSGGKEVYLIRIDENEDKFSQLESAYSIIEDLPIHIVVPVVAYMDEEINFALQLATHCHMAKSRIGVIGVKPIDNPEEILSYVSNLITNQRMRDGFYLESEDISHLISVVASEVIIENSLGHRYTTNGAASYAGLLSSLPEGSNPSNKILGGVKSLRYSFPSHVIESISLNKENNLVSFKDLIRNPLRPIDIKGFVPNNERTFYFIENKDYVVDFQNEVILWINEDESSGATSIVYSIDEEEALSNAGYVVFRSSTHGVFPRLGVTASNQKKLRDVGSVRDILYIIDTIKLLSEDLIGETRVQSVQNIDSRLRFFLNGLIRKQIIKTFSLRVYHEGHDVVINLDLTLFSSIESVTVAIDLGKQEESYE